MIIISPIQKLRLTIFLFFLMFISILLWSLSDRDATCKVIVVPEKTEATCYTYGTQQQAQIVAISLKSPVQRLFLKNIGTSSIYRSDMIVCFLGFFIFISISNYFQIYKTANPFHKIIELLLSSLFTFFIVYIFCRSFIFIESYNTFIDARLPKGLQQFKPHESNIFIIFFVLPIFEVYKHMLEKGKVLKDEIDLVV